MQGLSKTGQFSRGGRERALVFLPWIIITVFSVAYAALAVVREVSLQHSIDLGTYTQLLYNVSHGHFPPFNTLKGMVAWGDHAHFILVLFVPLYWLSPNQYAPLALQVAAVTTAGWPLFQVAQRRGRSLLFSSAVLLAYLLFFGVQYALSFDFHANTLTAAAFAWTLYAFEFRRWPLYWLTVSLGLLTREDAPTLYAAWALWLWLAYQRRWWRAALVTWLISVGYFLLVGYLIMPRWTPGGTPLAYFDIPDAARGPLEVSWWLLRNPVTVWQNMVATTAARETMRHLFQSFGWLPLLSPFTYVTAAPNFLGRFLSGEEQRYLMDGHYGVSLASLLAYGSILATATAARLASALNRWLHYWWISRLVPAAAAGILLLGTLGSSWASPQLPLRRLLAGRLAADEIAAVADRAALAARLRAAIPIQESVSASAGLVPALAGRPAIYLFPEPRDRAPRWYVLSNQANFWPLERGEVSRAIVRLRADPFYQEVAAEDGIYVFYRVGEGEP